MLNQIISHTPVYVWAILAFLIVRGVIALRTREVAMSKLFIIPVVMLALSLFDVAAKFGANELAWACWLIAAAATVALLYRFSAARVSPAPAAGHVVVRGSGWPLALMMSIFATKYITSIAVAVQPHLAQELVFTLVVCTLFGVFSGYFLGRLARDLKAFRSFSAPLAASIQAI